MKLLVGKTVIDRNIKAYEACFFLCFLNSCIPFSVKRGNVKSISDSDHSAGMKLMETEFTQCLVFFSVKPSPSNTCPR